VKAQNETSDGPPVAARDAGVGDVAALALVALLYVALYNYFHGNKKK
jgi:hypothetical protein